MARMSGREFDRRMNRLAQRKPSGAAQSNETAARVQSLPDRNREIAELANAVADEHCPKGIVQPPAIAADKGITISFGQYGDAFDGMLEHLAGRFHIYCNLDRLGQPDAPRARFTLAHELGHYFIDEHRLALQAGRVQPHGSACEYESPILAEQEADLFAANLLMPQRRFIDKAKASSPGLAGVLNLAKAFGTSITATALRYVDADLQPCAVIKWDWRGYAWKLLSTSAFRAYFRTTFDSPKDLPADCPTQRALAHQAPPECGYFQAGTTASAWFPRIAQGQWRDMIFIEEAMALGRFGVLTLLYPQSGLRS